ncbi:DUF58 domain-containing protein [Frondihabitans cladoniiphilus]|uniref:DUF58 domain-containing protein n=1 Tax=Frondihabitans cladoniiphilus TaxID=715785 RepID=A0ABP8VJ51_9MICO
MADVAGSEVTERGGFAFWPRPTSRGVGALVAGFVLGALGYLLASMPLVFAGVVLLVLVVAALVTVAVRPPVLTATRRFSPDRAVAGRDVAEALTLATTARHPVAVRVRDTLDWRRMAKDESAEGTIEASGRAGVSFLHLDLPRGRHRVGPARVEVVESFGLARRLVLVPGRTELVVIPDVVSIGGGRESRSLGEGARQRRDHSLAGGQDDPITREYRRGDPMRRVHWRATARQGELMVRQEEQHGLPSARVVLPLDSSNWRDAHPTSGSGASVSEGFEWAVSMAASIAVELGLAGSQTRVIDLGGGTLALHDPSSTPLFLELLADVALGGAAHERSPEPAPREPIVALVSTLTAAEVERLGGLRGPGVPGVALVVHLDDDVLTAPDTAPDSPRDVVAALRESGWSVVETTATADRAAVLGLPGVLGG